jgi:hypothetical protein
VPVVGLASASLESRKAHHTVIADEPYAERSGRFLTILQESAMRADGCCMHDWRFSGSSLCQSTAEQPPSKPFWNSRFGVPKHCGELGGISVRIGSGEHAVSGRHAEQRRAEGGGGAGVGHHRRGSEG